MIVSMFEHFKMKAGKFFRQPQRRKANEGVRITQGVKGSAEKQVQAMKFSVSYVKKTMWFPNMQEKVEETYLRGEMKSKRKQQISPCGNMFLEKHGGNVIVPMFELFKIKSVKFFRQP